MIEMVCGFLFTDNYEYVVLIRMREERPVWQAGHWNGVGGHVKEGEAPLDAMVREYEEEAGVIVPASCWKPTVRLMVNEQVVVHVFAGVNDKQARAAKTVTDERIDTWASWHLPPDVLPSLRWLVPLQWAKALRLITIEVKEPG